MKYGAVRKFFQFKSYKNLKAHGYSVSRKIGSIKNFTVNFNPDIYAALKA